ncbi:MAG: hypothetical protein HYY91_00205 [Candidatus Omnitrophica bacterium]|nr:hypothetical protein [Candidatus Omnitrophota bacterium]
MTDPAAAAEPFRFYTSLLLQEATGVRASTLTQLAKHLRQASPSCIYYHTHHFLLQHHYLVPEPTNDFAYWVGEILGDDLLAELLASIDTMEYAKLEELREALARAIEGYLADHPMARFKFVPAGQEFFFVKSVHVVLPTAYMASTLLEFAQALERVSLHSLYFHVFEARLRLGRPTNDFSRWFSEQLGLQELAERVSRLDPYAQTLDALRATLLALIREQLHLS